MKQKIKCYFFLTMVNVSTISILRCAHYLIGFASKRTLLAQKHLTWIISDPVTKFQKLPDRVML